MRRSVKSEVASADHLAGSQASPSVPGWSAATMPPTGWRLTVTDQDLGSGPAEATGRAWLCLPCWPAKPPA